MSWWADRPRLDELLAMDYVTHFRMRVATNIYNTVVKLRLATDERIHELSSGERRIIASLIESGFILLD